MSFANPVTPAQPYTPAAARRIGFEDSAPAEDATAFWQGRLNDANNESATRRRSAGSKFDLSGFTTDQLHSLTPYGAMLDSMSADQISGLLSKTSGSTPDGRALFASRPAPKRNFLDPQRRFVLSPGGDKLYF
jgi:hypothetical protein